MKIFVQILAAGFIVFSLYSCSSSGNRASEQKKTPEQFSVSDSNIYAWVNLMPGSRSKFHVTGELQIRNGGDVPADSIQIKTVKVSQSGKVFYSFIPLLDTVKPEMYVPQVIKNIHFSDGKGYVIDSLFNSDVPVILEFHILNGKEEFIYNSKEIKVEKVY